MYNEFSDKGNTGNQLNNEEHKELCLKNLSWSSTVDSVREALSELGPVVYVKLLTDKYTGKPKGIGFVEFEKRADAKKALEGLMIDGRTIECSWSNDKKPRDNNLNHVGNFSQGGFNKPKNFYKNNDEEDEHSELFVKNLSWESSVDAVRDAFSKIGQVVNVKLLKDRFTGQSKGLGFVEFKKRADAKKALEGVVIDGRTVECKWSNEKDEGFGNKFGNNFNQGNQGYGNQNQGFKSGGFGYNNNSNNSLSKPSLGSKTIFVGNLNYKTSEEQIAQFFSQCGNVLDVRIATRNDGFKKGFCHVDFVSFEACQRAMKLNGQYLDGREIRVDLQEPMQDGGNRGGFRGGFGDRGGRGFDRGGRGFGDRGGYGRY